MLPYGKPSLTGWGARLVFVVGSILLVAVFTAGFPAEAKKVTITYAGWGAPFEIESNKAEVAAFQKKYPNSEIEVKLQFGPWSGYHEKLIVQAAGGVLPDVMLISGSFFRNLAAYDMFLDLRPYFERDGLSYDNLPPNAEYFLTYKGRLLGMPATGFRPGGAMLVYNKEILANAAVPEPKADWTWENLLSIAMRTTKDTNGDGKPDIYGLNFAKTTWEAVWNRLLGANGGSFYNDTYDECAINSDAGIRTFQFLADLDDKYHVHGGNFDGGTTAMCVAWAGKAAQYLRESDLDIGLQVMPRGPYGYGLIPGIPRVHVFAISKSTKNPEAAWKFVKFLVTEPEAERARGIDSVAGVGWRALMPVFAEKLPRELGPWLQVALTDLKNTITLPKEKAAMLIEKPLPSYDEEIAALNKHVGAFYAGKIPVREALDNVKKEIDNIIRKLRKGK